MTKHMGPAQQALCYFYRNPPAKSGVKPQPFKEIAKLIQQPRTSVMCLGVWGRVVASDGHAGLSPGAWAPGTFGAKRGYIRVHSGTFGYIRVHSGVSAPLPDLPDTHENQRILGSTLSTQGTFAATTHPLYNIKKGELEFRGHPIPHVAAF